MCRKYLPRRRRGGNSAGRSAFFRSKAGNRTSFQTACPPKIRFSSGKPWWIFPYNRRVRRSSFRLPFRSRIGLPERASVGSIRAHLTVLRRRRRHGPRKWRQWLHPCSSSRFAARSPRPSLSAGQSSKSRQTIFLCGTTWVKLIRVMRGN